MQIHLIENADNFTKLRDKVWESGWWVLTEDEAKKLVGGQIYFHRKKSEPSFYGGSIRSFRIKQEDPHRGSVIFEFEYRDACRTRTPDPLQKSREKRSSPAKRTAFFRGGGGGCAIRLASTRRPAQTAGEHQVGKRDVF